MNTYRPIIDPHADRESEEPFFIMGPPVAYLVVLDKSRPQTDLTCLRYERFASDFEEAARLTEQ